MLIYLMGAYSILKVKRRTQKVIAKIKPTIFNPINGGLSSKNIEIEVKEVISINSVITHNSG